MSDKQITVLVIVLFVLVVPLSLGLAARFLVRTRPTSDQTISPVASGGLAVPVRGLKRRRLFGYSQNSVSPQLAIVDGELRFKVFKPDRWLIADVARVDAPWSPFVTRVILRHRTQGELDVDLAGKARAREFLRALPPGPALTPRAIALRDDPA